LEALVFSKIPVKTDVNQTPRPEIQGPLHPTLLLMTCKLYNLLLLRIPLYNSR